MSDRAIWKVRNMFADYWFATKRDAVAYMEWQKPRVCELERVSIGRYMDPKQTVQFLRTNFGSVYHDYGEWA